MKRVLPLAVGWLVFLGAMAAAQDPQDEVRQAMNQYMAAALAQDGPAVAALLSEGTVATYDRFRGLALEADREELETLGPYELFSVLHLRHRLDGSEIRALSGRQLLIRSYDEGWNSKRALETVRDLGDAISMEVSIHGNQAELEMRIGDQALPPAFPLVLESGGWKVDMAAMFPHFDARLRQVIGDEGSGAEVLELLELATGTPPDPEIWKPLSDR